MRNGYCTRVSACGKFSKNKSRGKDHRCAEFEFVRIDFRFCGIFIFAIDFSQPTLTRDDGTKIWTPWFVRNWKMFVFIAGLLNDGTRPSYIVATRGRRVYQLVIRISKIFCIPDQFFFNLFSTELSELFKFYGVVNVLIKVEVIQDVV